MCNSEDQDTSLNDSTGVNIDSDHDSSDIEHVSPDSSMIFTQCVPQIQMDKRYDNEKQNLNEDKGISKRSIETQCNILKRSFSTRDVAVQTDNEKYAIHCQKKAAIYVGQVDNVYLDIEMPNEIKPRKSIRLGLSKKWKLEYKENK